MFLSSSSIAEAAPAGGAAIDQVAIATTGATIVSVVLIWLCAGHRSGRVPWLSRFAATAERLSGLPGWAALPSAIAALSLNVALLGMYWDISLHIDDGRDAGPLANPAHYLILVGLYGVFAAGVLAVALPRRGERPGPAAVRIGRDWYAPVGGILMALCGGFALIGFPLDDMWHRLFGQDVTLWGPTHLMLIGGAGMTLVGQAVLLAEGMRQKRLGDVGRDGRQAMPSRVTALRRMGIVGGFLIGLSTFQAEFDFGVPQYAQVFQPFLIALAAGVALVAARLWIGPGGAVLATVFYFVLRGVISLVVGDVFGQTMPSLPLYFGEAACVELVALALAARPLALGATSGALIGTVGFATEYAWSHVTMRLPWEQALLPEGIVFAVAGGVAGGLVGALLATGLRGRLTRPLVARATLAGAGLVVAACVAVGLQTTVPDGVRATVTMSGFSGAGADRTADATVRIAPASAAADASWLTATSWQGGGMHVDRLAKVGDGVYRTTEPLPVGGDWKAMIRLLQGRDLTAIPVYLPNDPAIPGAREVPAAPRFERTFGSERQILQRERKADVSGALWAAASALVLALYVVFFAALAWGVGRLSRRWNAPIDDAGGPPPAREEPVRFGRAARPVATA